MFPIPWNRAFRKKDGSLVNISDAMSGGGYELPIASASTLGGIKVGSGLSIDENGELSADGSGGGGNLYCHCITINSGNIQVTTMIINDSSSAITIDDLKTFLTSNNFTLSDRLYFASGKSNTSAWAIGLGIASNVIKVYDTAGQWVNVTSGINDAVIAI